ncbi:MAG: adenosine kinase [Candidatus Anstonellales archaeon]
MARFDVFGVGTPVIDYYAYVKNEDVDKFGLVKGSTNYFSNRGELDKIGNRVKIIKKSPGDNARNVCEGVCYLGGSAAYGGAVGKDEDGRLFTDSLEKNKIEASIEELFKRKTGKVVVLVDEGGDRTFAADLGAGEWYEKVDEKKISNSSFFYVTSITLCRESKTAETALKCLKCAMDYGIRIAYSLESPQLVQKNRERILKTIEEGAYILFANMEELKALAIDAKEFSETVPLVCLKIGADGSAIYHNNSVIRISAKSVTNVVDTTGAGDAYAAGFLFGLSRGADLKKCGQIATELASRVIGKVGSGLSD